MAIILRLQGLPWSASASDIRQYFSGLNIPDGGVHIVGGEEGDVFIAFATDEDARQAMRRQKEPLMGMRVMILLSSKSEMQEVIAKSRQAQGRDPFQVDAQSVTKESPAAIDAAPSAVKNDYSGQQTYDRRDMSFASPMSPDPSQGGRPITGDAFQDRRMSDQEARNRKYETPFDDPYPPRGIVPENGSFGHAEGRSREYQDQDTRTPRQAWQRDAYPDGKRDAGQTSFIDSHQPYYSDPPRGDGLLGDVPGHRIASQPPRAPPSHDQSWPRGDPRNKDPFTPDHSRDNPTDGPSVPFSQRGREDPMQLGQRYGRPTHPQDPFEGAGRDFVRGEYAHEPGREGRPLRDRNFGPPKEGPLVPDDPSLPHDIAYQHELEESLSVYLKGLPFTVKEHEVVDFFRGLRIARDGIKFVIDPRGRITGEGFVKFVSKRDNVEALKRHKSYMTNRFIEVIPCTEAEYQSMKPPRSVLPPDRLGPEGPPPRGREMFRRDENRGIPGLLDIPTQEPFTPQDRDHRRDMPPGGRDGPGNFQQRNRGPGGPYFRDHEGGPGREGFHPGSREGGPIGRERGPGMPHPRFRDEDENPMEAGMPGVLHGKRGQPTGRYGGDRMEFDEFGNRIPADLHGRPEMPLGRLPAPFERDSGRQIGPMGRDVRAPEGKYEWERGRPEAPFEKDHGRAPGYFDRERGRPDGPMFERDRGRLEGQFERDYRHPGGPTDRDGGFDRERKRPERPGEKDKGRSDGPSEKEKQSRLSQREPENLQSRTTTPDMRDKVPTSETSYVRNKDRDRGSSDRGSSRERNRSDRTRSKEGRDKNSSGDERSKDRVPTRDKHVHNGPYTTRNDHSDRDRRRSPSKSSRSHRDRSRSPIRSMCVEIKGIPFECQTEDIYQFFKGLQVASEGVFIPYDSKTGKTTGQCYVNFASEQDAQNACKKTGSTIGHNVIDIYNIPKEIMEVRVKEYKKRLMDSTTSSAKVTPVTNSPQKQTENGKKAEQCNVVKMENVPYVCTLDEIFSFFNGCQIARRGINFIRHVDGINAGKSTGVVFVEFVNESDATRAKARNENPIRGRNITVTAASREAFEEAIANQANRLNDRRQVNRDSDDRIPHSGPQRHGPSGPQPLMPRFGGPLHMRPGMGPPRLSRPGRPGLVQGGPPRQPHSGPRMPGEEKKGPPEVNIQKLGNNNCVIGITNLPIDIGIPAILNFFQDFSPLPNSVRLHFSNSGQPTGDALIAFPTPMLTRSALEELNGAMYGGRPIGLKLTQPPPGVM
ncbi:RNA-binding protein 12-like [Anneissia japonica]|uniref:RNA-binding protein 12-like n=1 Tax=Anneissia japonica TaxID=1529436 RepID=UPI0014258A29|nr:RNA-binding protein 12-like [Anneissia japonica]